MHMDWEAPWDSLRKLRSQVDRGFEDLMGTRKMPDVVRRHIFFPRMDISESAMDYVVECELPGVRKESVEVTLKGRELRIHAERPLAEQSGRTWLRQERTSGKFCRVMELPMEVKSEELQATLRDGVLTVRLPKPAQAQTRRIQVTEAE